MPWFITTGLEEVLQEERISYHGLYAVYDEGIIEKSSEEDMAWSPIVSLLQLTLQLRDLIYDCQSQFPPSLLMILHEQHPQCRLHHLTFKFRTLLWGVPLSYEMELATSPSLYRMKVARADCDTDGDDDFNLEAAIELASGLAPNPKEVTVLNLRPERSSRLNRARESWLGLLGFTIENTGSLTSLSLKGVSCLNTPALLQRWARHTNFGCLKHLALGGCFDAKTSGLSGETMDLIAHNHSFPRSETLDVYLARDDLFVERSHYSHHAVSFFQNFEPLEQLFIDGPLDSNIVITVLSHHGRTLKTLNLHPFEEAYSYSNTRKRRDIPFEFTKDHILQIKVCCSVLEELTTPIKRNRSGMSESESYRCLSSIRNLRRLFLKLDCSNWRVVGDHTYKPQFDEESQKFVDEQTYPYLKKSELEQMFINCAVDEVLTQSIWKIISQNKTNRRLERLKLWPAGGGEYGGGYGLPLTFTAMARNTTRS